MVRTSEGTKYGYDHRGLRFFKEKNGRVYSYYDLAGKLRYRLDRGAQVESEYHYIGNELIAKREISNGAESPPAELPENPPSGGDHWTIDHANLTISWNHSAWHQVQYEDGTDFDERCNGGKSCKVPGPGKYKLKWFGDNPGKEVVTIGNGSSVSTDGDYTINHSTRTISWSVSGWHQIQTENGENLDPKCEGGTSCTVPKNGTYKVINFGKPESQRVKRVKVGS